MLQKITLVSLSLFMLATLAGCVTPRPGVVGIKDQSLSFGELKTIIQSVIPMGVRKISPNGREFLSQVYIIKNGQYSDAKEAHIRYWAKILVLNESRPYDVEIEVHKEVRIDRDGRIRYVDVGPDLSFAQLLRSQLKDRLAKRRDDLNLIDDFRVF